MCLWNITVDVGQSLCQVRNLPVGHCSSPAAWGDWSEQINTALTVWPHWASRNNGHFKCKNILPDLQVLIS